MASCLITTGGTNGTLRINYNLSGIPVTAYHNFGDTIYIEDTATDITYTTLTGDVTAASGCVTITELEMICYLFKYDRLTNDDSSYDPKFDAVVVGATINAITETSTKFIHSPELVYAINNTLADETIKITAVKFVEINDYHDIYFIMRIVGSDVPMLRIKSPNNNYSYLIGTVSVDCVPSGYYDYNICTTPAP